MRLSSVIAVALLLTSTQISAQSQPPAFTPLRLKAGTNVIPNIAGDGRSGSITLDWVENGNVWSYDIFTVRVGNSVAKVEGADRFTDQPHTGDDMIRAVRFAKGRYGGRSTTFAFVAHRTVGEKVAKAAPTQIRVFTLVRNDRAVGTPYHFVRVRTFQARRLYCNADVALTREAGLPVRKGQAGPRTLDGC